TVPFRYLQQSHLLSSPTRRSSDLTLLTSYLKAVGRRSDVDPDQVWLFAEYFGDRSAARTTLQANLPGFDIEVVAILYSPSTGERSGEHTSELQSRCDIV